MTFKFVLEQCRSDFWNYGQGHTGALPICHVERVKFFARTEMSTKKQSQSINIRPLTQNITEHWPTYSWVSWARVGDFMITFAPLLLIGDSLKGWFRGVNHIGRTRDKSPEKLWKPLYESLYYWVLLWSKHSRNYMQLRRFHVSVP